MKLFYSPSSCSLAPHIVLRELGVPFTLERVDSRSKRTASGLDYLTVNPLGYVPALELDDGTILTEGPAITQYLADKYAPGRLAPLAGTIKRARVNAWLNFIGMELHKPFGPLFSADASAAERAAIVRQLQRGFGLIEGQLSNPGPYLTGAEFTLADAYLFAVQNWAPMTGVDLAPFPNLAAFSQRVARRPAVQAALVVEGVVI